MINANRLSFVTIAGAAVLLAMLVSCSSPAADTPQPTVPSQETIASTPAAPAESSPIPTPAETPAAPSTSFDPALAGRWKQVSAEHSNEAWFDLGPSVYFLPDGTVFSPYNENLCDYTDYIEAGREPIKATTEENKLFFMKSLFQFLLDTRLKEGTQAEVEAMEQLNVIYELSDIQVPSGNSDYQTYYGKYDNDQLTLHITGTLNAGENSAEPAKIDTTLVYEKEYPTYDWPEYLHPCLVGEWDDNMGNQWSFRYEKNENAEYKFRFSGIGANDGKNHDGQSVSVATDADCKEWLSFTFEDGTYSPDYEIISYDGTVLTMKDETGNDFIMTRK